MKKLSFMAMAALGLLFAACSSDKDTVGQAGNEEVQDGNQFISLAIDMPTVNSLATRSDGVTDDNNYGDGTFELNDGLASEYTVKDALLIIFHPASSGKEDDATYVGAFDINPEPWTNPSDKQVTETSVKIVQKVGSTVADGDLALVILNRNNLVTYNSSTKTLEVAGAAFTVGKTYKEFRETQQTAAALGAAEMTANGFFMANTPLTDKAGSTTTAITGAKVRTLIPIDKVYPTEAEALAAAPAHIYVERGMAKVTLRALAGSLKLGTQYTQGGTPVDLPITFMRWTIDHTNTKSYTVRSTEGHDDFLPLANQVNPKYRYAGMSDITEGSPATYKYRTYFAKDPNYDAPVTAGVLKQATTADYTTETGDDHPRYCFENTFDVANQNVMNTTLARIKVQVGTEDLYLVNGNKSTIYKNGDVVTLAKNAAINYISAEAGLGHITVSGTVVAADFNVTVSTTAGTATVTITQATTLGSKITSGSVTDANLQTAVNASLKEVVCYADGESYYTIRIKHFGDQLTPWHTGAAAETPAPVVGNIYPGVAGTASEQAQCAANYLGRYGVLRNNWYDIQVNSIKYLGEATPKDYSSDPTTDDELDGYISVQIHIMSWAKRTQAWDL